VLELSKTPRCQCSAKSTPIRLCGVPLKVICGVIIKQAGGVPVIAHPKSIGNDATINDLIQYGVQGLEVFHPIHTKDDITKYQQLAEDKRLYISGGTDWHGKNNGAEITRFGMRGLENDNYPILSY
jgi:hypothetical protein